MRIHAIVGLLALGLLAGCATSSNMYGRNDSGKPWIVQEATVRQISEATIDGKEDGYIGTVGGGLIGHSLGYTVGSGAGSAIAGAVGAVAGAIIGSVAEKKATQKRAWEIEVEPEGGSEHLVIVQPADQNFSTGEKVKLYTRSDGSARVAKL
ncbi:MAG TPA: hypothetical protein VJT80_01965 [Steroidobacteraceae bacterium]|nr:hypothetical protein [Steroidobacteraceae bacterium]